MEERGFLPVQPTNWDETDLIESDVAILILKSLHSRGNSSGRGLSERLRLPFLLVEPLLWRLTQDQLIVYCDAAPMNDAVYQLTDAGREKARRSAEHCAYDGAAPVSLDAYIQSVQAQSIRSQHLTLADLQRVFSDLLLPRRLLDRLGPAVNSGRGLLLYGAPGNGKTSIAERVSHAFDDPVWIPRVLGIDDQIVRLFDPLSHEEVPLEAPANNYSKTPIDHRWVRIRRPTITVGGELTLESLEITFNASTGIGEAPLQLKSNCGTLVIDDFGRQRISVDQLLNRWIVPLEKRYDFLSLANGKKLQVPFDCLVIFSTNLSSKELNHEGFLRRIPYKIEVPDPSESDFRSLLQRLCQDLGISHQTQAVDYLIDRHYKAAGRSFRYCHPRDLMLQIRGYCFFHGTAPELTEENIDTAVANYFSDA
ncbi:MAG: AAA family ATPase [Planctomycetaceae bacterium]|nr:MAG: AAA family ATPase [Planctomycetaceae bacterium]